MKPLHSSNKGVETAPMYVVFSAFVMVLTAGIVYPALMDFQDHMREGKALKEMMRLGEALDEICTVGEVGNVRKLDLDVPEPYYIKVHNNDLTLKKLYGDGKEGGDSFSQYQPEPYKLKNELEHFNIVRGKTAAGTEEGWIYGKYEVMITCYDESFSKIGDNELTNGQILVKSK